MLAFFFLAVLGLSWTNHGVLSSPVRSAHVHGNSTSEVSILPNGTLVSPHWVIYSDRSVSGLTGPPPVSQIEGFNVFALAFLLVAGAFDKAAEWTQLTSAQRATIKAQYAAAGIKLIVSVFGSTDAPTTNGADPIATADTMAAWVIQYGLDGVDVDYEDFDAINAGDGKAEAWLASFTRRLRVKLPREDYLLTHAPVAPWFSPGKFGGGAYLTVDSTVGSLIDWYNVQFYNRDYYNDIACSMTCSDLLFVLAEGVNEYTTCAGLLTNSSSTWPKSALFQIAASGIPLNKLVIGKPALTSDASNGFMNTSTLASCLNTAKKFGWNAGAMVWEFPDANSSWITSVRRLSFPV
ncbi:glycoside hydrolase [Lentinula aff. lateritia]|uniref:Glycoside hydrolase n=1 Tax=Lentinula aff. lateritia TaxID=2804960 RepID=A0ACC1UEF4_9AGAR|nr:glycoside hydrolase [Lentinula aff. lateritia]